MGNLMGIKQNVPTVGQSASRISHLPPKGEVGNVEGSPGKSRFPSNSQADGKRETGKGKGKGKTSVLETRTRDGLKWRRVRTETGRTYWTVEVPETVLRSVATAAQVEARLKRWQSGEFKRERIAEIGRMAVDGVKPDAIAAMFPELSRGQVLKHCATAVAERTNP